MTAQTFLQFDLVLHITGFTMMAGIILADFAINRRMNRYIITDKPRAVNMMESASGFPRLILLNGTIVLRRNSNRLKVLLQTNDDRNNGPILLLKNRLGVFHGLELLFFLIIFVLSIFRF
jgi:hypothetical protein